MWKHPPGDEIYRKGVISVFEVDGKKNKVDVLLILVRKKISIFVLYLTNIYHLLFVDLLPKPLSPCQTLPGPQDIVLRRGAIPLLCDD